MVPVGNGVYGERSSQAVGFFLPVEVRSLPGPQERGTGGTLGGVSWGVETEATRPSAQEFKPLKAKSLPAKARYSSIRYVNSSMTGLVSTSAGGPDPSFLF